MKCFAATAALALLVMLIDFWASIGGLAILAIGVMLGRKIKEIERAEAEHR
jgi:hypothetical protein